MLCADSDLAAAMPRIVADISFANFKDEMALVTGKPRAKRYGQVWGALYGIEEDRSAPGQAGRSADGALTLDDRGRLMPSNELCPFRTPNAWGGDGSHSGIGTHANFACS